MHQEVMCRTWVEVDVTVDVGELVVVDVTMDEEDEAMGAEVQSSS
jgi:hypothetical protein